MVRVGAVAFLDVDIDIRVRAQKSHERLRHALAAAFTGMFIGQAVRTRLQPEAFRRWFLMAMLLLGIYLAGSALVKVLG